MLAIWPDCKFRNREWVDEGVDSFWIRCSPEEVTEKVIPLLGEGARSRMEEIGQRNNPKHPKRFFLVAKDLSSIEPFQWSYPFANLWNAYSPFRKVDEVIIDNLDELLTLDSQSN